MSLAFLLPAGFAALAALLLPLLLHLARRHEQKPTDFSALRWLRQKPRPRHRVRFDEWPLLLLRLLLLALLALWLARPVLSGAEDDAPWIVAVPGVDTAQMRAQDPEQSHRLHWLAPGFPSLDEAPPTGSLPVGSLLRQLDAELPEGVALTVVVPATLQGADAQRPVLSRTVRWTVMDGAMPAATTPAASPPALVVRHAGGDETGLRYLRAAVQAWSPPDGAAPSAISLDTNDQAIPSSAKHLVWLAPGALPSSVRQWIDAGGIALLGDRTELAGFVATTVPWRDAQGAALVESADSGKGRVLRFTRPLRPAAMPELLEADFPRRLRDLFAEAPPAPTRVLASDYAPIAGGTAYPTAPRDLQPWLALLIALLALVERWLATRRQRSVAP
ncbi:BatA domain-containing protein [Pseudoxanthomonas putridarboris]|uniref:BatA domain-containing protein n=1 Tax=Pseudoxanthomonas putridarboris TaxID=752605 RepID=A0ABU9IY02_9GAMM